MDMRITKTQLAEIVITGIVAIVIVGILLAQIASPICLFQIALIVSLKAICKQIAIALAAIIACLGTLLTIAIALVPAIAVAVAEEYLV
jgi:hypothetical protein